MIAQPFPIARVVVVAGLLLVLAAGCASGPAPVARGSMPTAGKDDMGARAARVALDQVGAPYRYGGTTPGGFDCSGLVQYAYARAGLRVPRTTGQLWSTAATVERSQLRAGDILFFRIEGKASHVGLYLGEQRFVHAPSTGRRVSVESLDEPFYRSALIRAGRLY